MNAEALGAVGDEENLGPMPYNLIVLNWKANANVDFNNSGILMAESALVVTLSTSLLCELKLKSSKIFTVLPTYSNGKNVL